MMRPFRTSRSELISKLSEQSYWPAEAVQALEAGKYSRAVEICKEHLRKEPSSVSGRLTYALALHRAGQVRSSAEQFHEVLALDPDHLVALKYLGDIEFAEGDEVAAVANYERILVIDPDCRALKSDLPTRCKSAEGVALTRAAESASDGPEAASQKQHIHFYTETYGDLYLAQGHSRQAAEIYRVLNERSNNPRLAEKLDQAERKVREREH